MGHRATSRPAPTSPGPPLRWGLPLTIVVATVLAYLTSFDAVFVFDSQRHIVEAESIRDLGEPVRILTATRRPVVNLSLAVNYALGDLDPWGYHAFNLGIHVLAALTLYGVIRRTLRRDGIPAALRDRAAWLAWSTALLWAVHPLQTQSVTYVIQRAESMMGLFYLLTLYCLLRTADSSDGTRRWAVAAVVSCALGMASKAVMVTAPITALIFDRVFLAGSFREVMRRRGLFHLALAATWAVLGVTGVLEGVFTKVEETASVGFGFTEITPLEYLVNQGPVILHYLRVSFWPHPLCLDHAWAVRSFGAALPPAIAVGVLAAAAIGALRYRPRTSFAAVAFFLVLAPTSSIVPVRDLLFEHRMYLPLAAVIVLCVLAASWVLQRVSLRAAPRLPGVIAIAGVLGLACALGAVTWNRNKAYHSTAGMWRDVLRQYPDNKRAHTNLGAILMEEGALVEARAHFARAVAIDPRHLPALHGLGTVHLRLAQPAEAVEAFRRFLDLQPEVAEIHNNIGNALYALGRFDEAAVHAERALRLRPETTSIEFLLAGCYRRLDRAEEALAVFDRILTREPANVTALLERGRTLLGLERQAEAEASFRRALEVKPDSAEARQALEQLNG